MPWRCRQTFRYRVSRAHGNGPRRYNKLFHHHQRLIYYEVNKVWEATEVGLRHEKADFLQEGAQGLLRAIRLFDVTRGVRFSTYVRGTCAPSVSRALRDKSHIVCPADAADGMMQIRKARYRYAVENQGHVPSDSALAEMLSCRRRASSMRSGARLGFSHALDAETMALAGLASTEPMMSRVASPKHDSVAAEKALQTQQKSLRKAMADRDLRRIQIRPQVWPRGWYRVDVSADRRTLQPDGERRQGHSARGGELLAAGEEARAADFVGHSMQSRLRHVCFRR